MKQVPGHCPQVSPEVLRELDHGVARDAPTSADYQAAVASGASALLFGGKPPSGPGLAGLSGSMGQHVTEDMRQMAPVPMMVEEY